MNKFARVIKPKKEVILFYRYIYREINRQIDNLSNSLAVETDFKYNCVPDCHCS